MENFVDLQRNLILAVHTIVSHSAASGSSRWISYKFIYWKNAQLLTCSLHLGGTANTSQYCCHQFICMVGVLVVSLWLLTDFRPVSPACRKTGCGFMHIGTVVAHWKSNSSITESIFALHIQVLWIQNILQQYGNIFLTDQRIVLCAVDRFVSSL